MKSTLGGGPGRPFDYNRIAPEKGMAWSRCCPASTRKDDTTGPCGGRRLPAMVADSDTTKCGEIYHETHEAHKKTEIEEAPLMNANYR
jgi:hypothetical protein